MRGCQRLPTWNVTFSMSGPNIRSQRWNKVVLQLESRRFDPWFRHFAPKLLPQLCLRCVNAAWILESPDGRLKAEQPPNNLFLLLFSRPPPPPPPAPPHKHTHKAENTKSPFPSGRFSAFELHTPTNWPTAWCRISPQRGSSEQERGGWLGTITMGADLMMCCWTSKKKKKEFLNKRKNSLPCKQLVF